MSPIKDSYAHTPIMVTEIINHLPNIENPIVVDCTCGEGGHSEALAREMIGGTLLSIDRDPRILEIARKRLVETLSDRPSFPKMIIKESNFSNLPSLLDELHIDKVDFFLYDLGISMYHYKVAKNGFSFTEDESLDMRLDRNTELTAYDIVNSFSENEIRNIVFTLGEESWAKIIARNIVRSRKLTPIKNANDLQKIVFGSIPKGKRPKTIHPATKTFQALRIYVNQEFYHIEQGLIEGIRRLNMGGRMAVLSFHSLEDRIVKKIFKHFSQPCVCPEHIPICQCGGLQSTKILRKKPMTPSIMESQENPSARSAKLRIVEKIHETSNQTWELWKKTCQKPQKVFDFTHRFSHLVNH